jgi:hypothetical protein
MTVILANPGRGAEIAPQGHTVSSPALAGCNPRKKGGKRAPALKGSRVCGINPVGVGVNPLVLLSAVPRLRDCGYSRKAPSGPAPIPDPAMTSTEPCLGAYGIRTRQRLLAYTRIVLSRASCG